MPNGRAGRSRAGFTMAEVLTALGILVVLLAVAIPSVVSIRASLKMTELDNTARQIFAAAQNQMTQLRAAGTLQSLSGQEMTEKPKDFNDSGLTWEPGRYRYLEAGSAGIDLLLPSGSIDAAVRDRSYVIEYDSATAMVYGVYYAETKFTYADACALPSVDRADRKKIPVGYYGGSGVTRADIGQCEVPDAALINAEELYLKIKIPALAGAVPEPVTYTVRVADQANSENDTEFSVDTKDLNPLESNIMRVTEGTDHYYKIVLDSLADGLHFKDLCPNITPGADLSVTVTASQGDKLPAVSGPFAENSLFADRSGDTVGLRWPRHLQNLSTGVSKVDEAVEHAVQRDTIVWPGEYPSFLPIENIFLQSYDGGGNAIKGLRILADDEKNAGLFGTFGNNYAEVERFSVAGVDLVNPSVTGGDLTSSAGMLVGFAANVDFTNCRTYLESTAENFDYAAFGVTAKGIVGGLVGSADNCVFARCSASLPSLSATAAAAKPCAGGLVGTTSRCRLTKCYADIGLWADGNWSGGFIGSQSVGGLVGYASETRLQDCYAVGYVNSGATLAAGLMISDDDSAAESCYSALQYDERIPNPSGLSNQQTSGTWKNCFYLDAPNVASANALQACSAGTLSNAFLLKAGDVWTADTSNGFTRPYGSEGDYPFPRLSALYHYGDWPDAPDGPAWNLAYYEAYSDGSYGYALTDTRDNSATLDTLIPDTDTRRVLADGYAFLGGPDADPKLTVSYSAGTDTVKFQISGIQETIGGTAYTVYRIAVDESVMNKSTPVSASGFYHKLTIDGADWYFNPNFAKTAWNTLAEPAAAPDSVSVRTARQLSRLAACNRQALYKLHYIQELDVDFTTYGSEQTLLPIGGSGHGFAGVFDGGGHRITGTDVLSQTNYGGLFGIVESSGTVKNVVFVSDLTGVLSRKIQGASYVGSLVGLNRGTVQNCAAAGFQIDNAKYVGGFVGWNESLNGSPGSIRNCAAVNASFSENAQAGGCIDGQGGYSVGGFVGYNRAGIITDCYAVASIRADRAGGFIGTQEKENGSVSNSYCISVDGNGKYLAFGSDGASYSKCYAQDEMTGPADWADLRETLGGSWGNADAAHSHPYAADLSGKAYPFPAVVEHNGAKVHFGDWPTKDLKNVELAYYEVYQDNTIAFYSADPALSLTSQLRDTSPVIQDGYCLLFRADQTKHNKYNGIPFSQLPEQITCSWSVAGGKTERGTVLLTVQAFPETLRYQGENLNPQGTISLAGADYLPLFLPARVVVTDGAAEAGFYQTLALSDSLGAERTFWYNPHFAKSEVSINQKPDLSKGITACIRTERHFATLATRASSGYWSAGRTYLLERDLSMVEDNPYVKTYFSTSLTSGSNQKYRSDCDRIGVKDAPFQGKFDGQEHTLDLAGKVYSISDDGGAGVFGAFSGDLYNLTVKNITINKGNTVSANAANLGALIGSMTSGTVENVTVSNAKVTGNRLVGGGIGRLAGGTVNGLTVKDSDVKAGRLAGGAFGQIINESVITVQNVTVSDDTEISTQGDIPVVLNENAADLYNNLKEYGFGTGGFAGAVVLRDRYNVSLDKISVSDVEVTVEPMNNSGSAGACHAGAAFVGNAFGCAKGAGGKTGILSVGPVSLVDCEIETQGGGPESAYGLLFGRIKLSTALTIGSLNVDGCSLEADGQDAAVQYACIGGYVGLLSPGGPSIQSNNRLILTLPSGTLAAVDLKDYSDVSALGGVFGRIDENTVVRGSQLTVYANQLSGTGDVGGFVGRSAGNISDVSLHVTRVSGSGNTGGFTGVVTLGEIKNCDIQAEDVSGAGNTGGFVGFVTGSGASISNCFAAIPVTGHSGNVGGFAGAVESSRIERCYASGTVTGGASGSTGGFAGLTTRPANGTIPLVASCYAAGAVSVPNETSEIYAGGFVGKSEAGSILSSYSVGPVTVDGLKSNSVPVPNQIGGFLGSGEGLSTETSDNNYILSCMVSFYNILQTTKVTNRNSSNLVSAATLVDGKLDTTNCMNVIEYLTKFKKGSDVAYFIDSKVPLNDASRGSWNEATGQLTHSGLASYGVIEAMQNYPELLRGSWMAQRNADGEIDVYWTFDDLGSSTEVTAYKYVHSEGMYYTGTMDVISNTVRVETPAGNVDLHYPAIRVRSGFQVPTPMPSTMTIDGYYLYQNGGQNYTAQEVPIRSFRYSDYQYDGIERWLKAQFMDEVNQTDASKKVFKVMKRVTSGSYPYPALPGVGCGVGDGQYVHDGGW